MRVSKLLVALVLSVPFVWAQPVQAAPQSMTLNAALEKLASQNLDLTLAELRADQAAALVREAQAALHPTLAATGSYVRNNDEVQIGLGDLLAQIPGAPNVPPVVIQPLDAWTATGTLRVPMFVPVARNDVAAARAGQRVATAARKAQQAQIKALFAQLAYSASALREVVLASERAIELASEQVRSAERRLQAGTTAPLDVLRAKAEQVSRESDLVRANADLERAQLALGVFLGQAVPLHVVVPELGNLDPKLDAVASSGSARREELAVIAAKAAAAQAQIDSAEARFLPQLHATASAFASDEPYPTGDNSGWRVGVELTVPLYDGGYRYGKRREAEAQLRLAQTEATQQRIGIEREILDARRELNVTKERLRLAETRRQLAADAAQSAKRSFEAGVSTTLDVLDANDKLYKAEVALAGERARSAQALIELHRATGTAF